MCCGQSITQRQYVLHGGLGPSGLLPLWSLSQDTSRSPFSEETSGSVWSGGRSRPTLLRKLRLREGNWALCSLPSWRALA